MLLILGAIYQQIAQMNDLRRYPPPGELVDVGGFRLHLHCEGEGHPTVIAEAALGSSSITWRKVQPAVAAETRMCSYDRAGHGWSDFDGELPTRQRVLVNLRTALENAGVDGPYVLVGHSRGGIFVRDFAAHYPEDVVGMVLVDAAHENQIARMPEHLRARREGSIKLQANVLFPLCQMVAATGVLRAFGLWNATVAPNATDETRSMLVFARSRTRFCTTMRNEMIAYRDDLFQEETQRDLGDLPLIVLTRGLAELRGVLTRGAVEPRGPDEERMEELWSELQAELASLSSEGQHRVVEDAGHNIQGLRPDAVIAAIREVVTAVSE